MEVASKLINEINLERERILKDAVKIGNLEYDSESSVAVFAKHFSNTYFRFLDTIEKEFGPVNATSAIASENVCDTSIFSVTDREKLRVYVSLAMYVIKISRQVATINGANRKVLLTNTKDMLVSFRSLVNYRDRSATTILSNLSVYPEIWYATKAILVMEMSAMFAHLHQTRIKALQNANDFSDAESIEMLTQIAKHYNACFRMYSRAVCNSLSLKLMLVNHYVKYLLAFVYIGQITYPIIVKYSCGNWKVCSKFIKELMSDDRIDEATKANWSKLSVTMANVFNITN